MIDEGPQYSDQELSDLGIKLHVDALDLSLINKKKYRTVWKIIVYNIWMQFGIDYFYSHYTKKLGHSHRFTWTQEVQDQFEKIFESELKTLFEGKITLPFMMEYYPLVKR